MNVRECVGTVVDLYGSWRFLAILCIFYNFVLDSAMCLALLANTTIECNKRCQESLKIIQNWAWKRAQSIQNETSRRFGDVLGALGLRNLFLEQHLSLLGAPGKLFGGHFGATWSILGAILASTGF